MTESSEHYFILTVIASDRLGIVEEVANYLYRYKCNIDDSRMIVLGGEFVMILLAHGKKSAVESTEKNLLDLGTLGLQAQFKATQSPAELQTKSYGSGTIRVTSIDHPGIVFQISQLLHEMNISIQNARTETLSAPFGGSPLFKIDMKVNISKDQSAKELEKVLNLFADKENMDISLIIENE